MNSQEIIKSIKLNNNIKDFVQSLKEIKDNEVLEFTIANLEEELSKVKLEILKPTTLTRTITPNREAKQVQVQLEELGMEEIPHKQPLEAKVKFEFPVFLYHTSGAELTHIPDDKLIYKPNYILKPNQKIYGVPGEWNVVVTHKDNKFITEHEKDYLNGLELLLQKPEA